LFTTECDELSENWPDSGMWESGSVYELQTWEPPISESASSSWLTPMERDHNPSGPAGQTQLTHQAQTWPTWNTPSTEDYKTDGPMVLGRYQEGEARTTDMRLRNQAMTWPTASASVANDGETQEAWERRKQKNLEKYLNGNGMGTPLTIAATTWPTAVTNDAEKRGDFNTERSPGLAAAARTWPTPNVPNGGRTTSTSNYREDGSKQQMDLGAVAEHWQTPGSDSFRSRGGNRIDEQGLDQQARMFPNATDSLTGATRNWTSPNVPNGGRTTNTSNYWEDGSKQQMDLGAVAANWPTASAHDGRRPGSDATSTQGANLKRDAENWRTPNTQDHHAQGPRHSAVQRQITLCDQAEARAAFLISPPAPPIPAGPPSSPPDQTSRRHWQTPSVGVIHGDCEVDYTITDRMGQRGKFGNLLEQVSAETQGMGPRRLNPRFVEWLMGFPLGWTESASGPCKTAPSDSADSATP
jgi:hypothetical protein